MDSAHKNQEIRDLIESVGAELWFLPPYSPDLNPIEKMWSKIKAILRTLKARTEKALINAIAKALEAVTASDAKGWLRAVYFFVFALCLLRLRLAASEILTLQHVGL